MSFPTLKRWISTLSVTVLALVMLAACGGGDPPQLEDVTAIPDVPGAPDFSADASPPAAGGGGEDTADSGGGAGPATHRLDGGDIFFEPTELNVAIGDTITLVNVGSAQHDFVIEGYNDDTPVDMPIGGEEINWTVPDDLAPGEYTFYCSIPGHRAAGMEGTITITEAAAPEAEEAAEEAPDLGAEATASEVVQVEAGDIYFEPTELTIPVGGTIELVNVGAAQHDFVIEGYNDDAPVDLPVGGEMVEWVVPDDLAPGEYTFYCSIPGHRQAGMEGTITIVEASAAPADEGAAEQPAATPDAGTPAAGTSADATPVGATPAADAASTEGQVLEAHDIAWNVTELTASVGGTIEMVNMGAAPHNFVIEGYAPLEETPFDLPVGGDTVEWTVPDDLAPGEYTYFCSIPGHEQLMRGTITITE